MPTRTSPDHPPYGAGVQRNVPGVHDRDPLLIPRLFKDPLPPWYRRRSGQVLAALVVLFVVVAALVLFRFGVKGTAELMGRFGLALLRTFAHLADR